MAPEVIAALIGAGVTYSVAFKDDILNRLSFAESRSNQYLLGKWDCTWDILSPAGKAQIVDMVEIRRVSGRNVKGKGSNQQYGDYELNGTAAFLAVSLTYAGKNGYKHLPGNVTLKLLTNDEMAGAWAQYFRTGEIVYGTTVWKRRP
jgi:hypothetical protein